MSTFSIYLLGLPDKVALSMEGTPWREALARWQSV